MKAFPKIIMNLCFAFFVCLSWNAAFAYELGPEAATNFWGILPDTDVDSAGNIHLVWGDVSTTYYSKFDGTNWTPAEEVGGTGHNTILYAMQEPRVAVDNSGNPHVSFTTAGEYEIGYSRKIGSGWDFRIIWPIWSEESDIDVDRNDAVHIVCHEIENFSVRYLKIVGGSIERSETIMRNFAGGWEPATPRLVSDSYNNIHVVINGGSCCPYTDTYKQFIYGENRWADLELPFCEFENATGSCAISYYNNIPIIGTIGWYDDQGWYTYAAGSRDGDHCGPWTEMAHVQTLDFDQKGAMPGMDIAADSDGNAVMIYSIEDGTGNRVKFSVREAGSDDWSEPQYVTDDKRGQEYPAVVSTGSVIYIFWTDQRGKIYYRPIYFNQAPQVLLGGCTKQTHYFGGYKLGGDGYIVAVVDDPNGISDLQSVVATYELGGPPKYFYLHDDGAHSDGYPSDQIYSAMIPAELLDPGTTHLINVYAVDKKGAPSDAHSFVTIHGNESSSSPSNSIANDTNGFQMKTKAFENCDYAVFMGGYLNTKLAVGKNSTFEMMAWVLPTSEMPSSTIQSVDVYYGGSDEPSFELPLVINDPVWGKFYSLSIDIAGDLLTSELANLDLLFEIAPTDSKGRTGVKWPYLENESLPTPTPSPEPTSTPENTQTPKPTRTVPPMPTNTPVPPTATVPPTP